MRALSEVVTSTAEGWSGYLRAAVNRGVLGYSPLRFFDDVQQFSRTLLLRSPADFHRTSAITREWPIARLRDFSSDLGATAALSEITSDDDAPCSAVPTLVVPPRSGHTSCVVDLSEHESLLRTALSAGLSNLHCIEWLSVPGAGTDSGIEAHLRVVADAIAELGGRVNVIGFSQGGWLAAIHAARSPESILTLTLAGAPVDCHRGRQAVPVLLRTLSNTGLGSTAASAAPWGLLSSTQLQLASLNAAEFEGNYARLARLWAEIGDDATVRAESAYQNWLQQPQAVPAEFLQWSIEHLFLGNELARGSLIVGGEQVDLAAIDCPLFLIAGRTDSIVPPAQLWALAELASTPLRDIVKVSAECGHLGLVADAEVLRTRWLPLLRDVALVSSARVGSVRV